MFSSLHRFRFRSRKKLVASNTSHVTWYFEGSELASDFLCGRDFPPKTPQRFEICNFQAKSFCPTSFIEWSSRWPLFWDDKSSSKCGHSFIKCSHQTSFKFSFSDASLQKEYLLIFHCLLLFCWGNLAQKYFIFDVNVMSWKVNEEQVHVWLTLFCDLSHCNCIFKHFYFFKVLFWKSCQLTRLNHFLVAMAERMS